jgi:hypothetical protein
MIVRFIKEKSRDGSVDASTTNSSVVLFSDNMVRARTNIN